MRIDTIMLGIAAGVLLEGFVKPIQQRVFKLLWRKLTKRTAIVEEAAKQTINTIDDFIISNCRKYVDELSSIVDSPNLSEKEIEQVKELVSKQYDINILLDKLQNSTL